MHRRRILDLPHYCPIPFASDMEAMKVDTAEEEEIGEKDRATLALTSNEEQLDEEKEEKTIEEQPLDEAPQASLVTEDLESTNKKDDQEQDPPKTDEQILVSGDDPNASQNQKAASTCSNARTSKNKRKTVDPVSEETKLEVKTILTEKRLAQDVQSENPKTDWKY
jgi:hypothetical protein